MFPNINLKTHLGIQLDSKLRFEGHYKKYYVKETQQLNSYVNSKIYCQEKI